MRRDGDAREGRHVPHCFLGGMMSDWMDRLNKGS